MQNLGKVMLSFWLNQNVNVIWHHDKTVDNVAFTIEMPDGLSDYFCGATIA